jgi:hypothetical protein
VTAAVADYERTKREHLQTATACRAQGLLFIPVVAEPSGGWGPSGLAALKHIAKVSEGSGARAPGTALREFLQQLCVAIRRADARAVLRRLGEPPPPAAPSRAQELLAALREEDEDLNLDGLFG